MVDVTRYLNLIQHNLGLLDLITGTRPEHLLVEDFSDWEATILFYIACIYIKTVCLQLGEDIQDHYTLRQTINKRKELLHIAKSYRHLEEASRDARYEGRKFKHSYLLERLLPKFNTVRDCAVGILRKHRVPDISSVDPKPFLIRLL